MRLPELPFGGVPMSGAYCRYCDQRCFVYRQVIVGGEVIWAGHMATCADGKAHDRRSLGVDSSAAHNPNAEVVR